MRCMQHCYWVGGCFDSLVVSTQLSLLADKVNELLVQTWPLHELDADQMPRSHALITCSCVIAQATCSGDSNIRNVCHMPEAQHAHDSNQKLVGKLIWQLIRHTCYVVTVPCSTPLLPSCPSSQQR